MRTARNITHRSHQMELKAKHGLADQTFQDMLVMLSEITPAERKTLKDPDFITEDEADLIVSNRRTNEPAYDLHSVMAEMGYTPRSRRAVIGWTVQLSKSARKELRDLPEGPKENEPLTGAELSVGRTSDNTYYVKFCAWRISVPGQVKSEG